MKIRITQKLPWAEVGDTFDVSQKVIGAVLTDCIEASRAIGGDYYYKALSLGELTGWYERVEDELSEEEKQKEIERLDRELVKLEAKLHAIDEREEGLKQTIRELEILRASLPLIFLPPPIPHPPDFPFHKRFGRRRKW